MNTFAAINESATELESTLKRTANHPLTLTGKVQIDWDHKRVWFEVLNLNTETNYWASLDTHDAVVAEALEDALFPVEKPDFSAYDLKAGWDFVVRSYHEDENSYSPERKHWSDQAVLDFVAQFHEKGLESIRLPEEDEDEGHQRDYPFTD